MDLNRPPLAAVQNRPRQLVASKPSGGPLNFTQYHTGWMDKQEAAFKGWLNAVLVPAAAAGSDEDGVHTSVQPQALAARRLVSRLRGLLWQLYSQDQNLISVMLKIEQRIDGGQLRMRDEESLMKNVKEGARARAVLASYHPLWLRLGIEVVVGVTVAGDDAPPTHAELAAFVRDHFLKDQQLAKLHPAGSKAYWASLAKLVLKRFLLLTALLDKALSAASLPSGAPLLFRKDSQLKASAQVLADFLLPRLTGEGDIVRTLGRLGYKLSYVQDPRWELDFAVNTMATDLRDGLRLCRLAELLTGHPRFFDTARFPSDRRPVRLANLQLALNQFARAGLPPQRLLSRQQQSAQQQVLAGDCGSLSAPVAAPVLLAASDLVDGDREMTLCLLWHLILHFQLPQLISLPSVRAEIQLVRSKAAAAAAAAADAGGSCTASRDAVELFQKHELEGTAETAHVAALLEWCAAVCALYGLPVRSFGACFGDGSTFCLLVHHYLGHAYIALKDVYRQPPAPPTDAAGAEQACWSGPAQARAGQADGARRNFALVHQVVLSLGGIPPIVSAEDFLEHGHDEKGCILFTAFLCQRLLEISKEERAAMVVQRHWRNRQQDKPGTARQHLRQWIAAATVVQRAVRSWLLRRGLRRFTEQRMHSLNAVVRLQALWRGRAVRRQYVQLRQAAICVQAVQRGRQCRLYVFNHLLVPRMLSAGLHHKKQLESSRYQARLVRAATLAQSLWRGKVQRRAFLQQRDAAVTVQAVVRGWLQQSLYQRQRQLAITVQALSRGRAVRRQLAQQQRAATSMQAVWRGWQQRQRFLGLRAAAVTVQSAWRARQARLLLSQHRAARQLQASWRGHVARRQVAAQRAAATAVQAAWRCYAARRAYQRQRSAAVTIQAAARMHAARARLLCSKRAVVCVQAAWRGFAVRHLLQRNQAATMIQCHVRGFQARCRLVQRHAAATAIQSAVRVWLAARHAASVAAVKRQMAEMAALMRQYQQRTAAARHIQAAYRGHAGRNEYRRRLAVLREKERMQAEREAAARAVITPWARTFVDRGWFLRAGKAVRLLQRWWKRQYRRRQAAAITIQANVRCFLAQRRLQSSRRAALVLQTAWRGAVVRASHPRCKQLADIRLRLAAAAANAVNAPHRSLGARTRAHLDALLTSKHPASAVAALTGLALSTEAVLACCDIVVAGGGLPLLLGIVRSPCRTKEAAEALRPALSCLANICRCRQHADAVFSAEGLLSSLGDHLQQQREKEELFMMVVLLWQRLVASPSPGTAARALALARQPEVLTKLEGVARLLALKVGAEQKYLTKLESSKGSDASARQATKALLSGSRQLRALRGVLAATGASAGSGDGKEELLQLGKNTLVRSVLHGHMT